MLRLCGFHLSNYHNKVRLALLEKGIPFQEDTNVHPSQRDEYLAVSPMGKVPIDVQRFDSALGDAADGAGYGALVAAHARALAAVSRDIAAAIRATMPP